jgi:hypothetical protein
MAVDLCMDILTPNCLLHPIRAASSLTDDFYMRIMGIIVDGCVGTIAID